MVEVSEERFDEMVNEALDQVPEEFVRRMRNLVTVSYTHLTLPTTPYV